MKTTIRNQKGFTLLEIVVVLAVLGALAAMLSPVVFRYIDDANRTRAQADVNTIAASIQQMYKDTGRWPYYKVGNAKFAYTDGTDAVFLTSASACILTAADLATCDANEPGVGSGVTGWDFTGKADSLTNQLIKGTGGTAYATAGPRAWKGPYLEAVPATDAWGRSYVVNISKADLADQTPEVVVVLSAGANGIIETNGDTLATAGNFTALGDDVIARVK